MDDNKKSLFRNWPFIPNRSGVRLSAHLAIESLIANYCMSWRGIFKGLSQDGGWADFSKNLCDTSFYKDLSNEPNFGLIHLAGQYL